MLFLARFIVKAGDLTARLFCGMRLTGIREQAIATPWHYRFECATACRYSDSSLALAERSGAGRLAMTKWRTAQGSDSGTSAREPALAWDAATSCGNTANPSPAAAIRQAASMLDT